MHGNKDDTETVGTHGKYREMMGGENTLCVFVCLTVCLSACQQVSAARLPALGLGNRSGTGGSAGCWRCWPETRRPGPLAAWAPCPQRPGCGAAGRCRSIPPHRPANGSRRRAASRSRPSPDLAWWWRWWWWCWLWSVSLCLSRTVSNRIA